MSVQFQRIRSAAQICSTSMSPWTVINLVVLWFHSDSLGYAVGGQFRARTADGRALTLTQDVWRSLSQTAFSLQSP